MNEKRDEVGEEPGRNDVIKKREVSRQRGRGKEGWRLTGLGAEEIGASL